MWAKVSDWASCIWEDASGKQRYLPATFPVQSGLLKLPFPLLSNGSGTFSSYSCHFLAWTNRLIWSPVHFLHQNPNFSFKLEALHLLWTRSVQSLETCPAPFPRALWLLDSSGWWLGRRSSVGDLCAEDTEHWCCLLWAFCSVFRGWKKAQENKEMNSTYKL